MNFEAAFYFGGKEIGSEPGPHIISLMLEIVIVEKIMMVSFKPV